MSKELMPNDVALIFRPTFTEGEYWDGSYTAFVTGFGPVTMLQEDMEHLITAALLVATAIPLAEKDKEFGEKLLNCFKEEMGDKEITYASDYEDYSGSFKLDADTKTSGGVQ